MYYFYGGGGGGGFTLLITQPEGVAISIDPFSELTSKIKHRHRVQDWGGARAAHPVGASCGLRAQET